MNAGFSREELDQEKRNGTALARVTREYRGIELATAPAEAERRLQELQAFIKSVMVEGINGDYGNIPGTGEKKVLFQPGAQKLAEIYGFAPRIIPVEAVKDWDRGFFYFEYRVELMSRRDGTFVGEGIGSCNSRESKYAGRWVPASELPDGSDKSKMQSKAGSRWEFKNKLPPGTDVSKLKKETRTSKRTGGTYEVYQIVDEQYLVPNPDPYSLVNTLQKMAVKRAYVHAVISATRSSGIFTQDAEDLPESAYGQPEKARTREHEPAHDAETGEVIAAHAEKANPVFVAYVAAFSKAIDDVDIKAIGQKASAEHKRGNLSLTEMAQLKDAKDARKAALAEAARNKPDATLDAPAGDPWGVTGSGEPEPGA